MKTVFEPFKIKMVEPIPILSQEERKKAIQSAFYNLFLLPAETVTFDFLTDSGTSAMSSQQWAAMMLGDESYAGSRSFLRFQKTIQELTGLESIIPTHQGRSAEALLCQSLLKPGMRVLGNTQFDTTQANIESMGGLSVNLPSQESKETQAEHPFKGNVDLEALKSVLQKKSNDVAFFIMTVTNNSAGGQPVSLENIRATKNILNDYGIPLFIDAARFAENAFFIKLREKAYASASVSKIAREMFSFADGVLMSAKKDAFANIGGFLALKDSALASDIRQRMVITEGFPTYGGLAGRDLEAIATGLEEIQDEHYLTYRIKSIAYFAEGLESAGYKVVKPYGGHAVYLDAKATIPHLKPQDFPAQSLATFLYENIGLRGVEIGSLMFGHQNPETGEEVPATQELVRLAFPRRVYTQSHIDYIIESAHASQGELPKLPAYRIVEQARFLRHFTAKLKQV